MRHIPTSSASVERLKKEAKRLQRTKGGKHADLLNKVARSAGYDHWHHVTICLRNTEPSALAEFCGRLIAAEAEERILVETTANTEYRGHLVGFSTGIGDAWLLEPESRLAACLVWQRDVHQTRPQTRPCAHSGVLEMQFDGGFSLDGPLFHVATELPGIGKRSVYGYPIDQIRSTLLLVESGDRRAMDVFSPADAVPLSLDVIADLARMGWERNGLELMAAQGAMYSPQRNSLITPPKMGGFDDEPPTG